MIELNTLGDASIRQDGAELGTVSAHRQKFALISYLAVEEKTTRDRLLGMMWPDKEEERARHALSQALHALKKELGRDLVQVAGDQISLLPDVLAVDVKEIEAAAEAERWSDVVKLYKGPFLDRFNLAGAPGFEQWRTFTRAWVGALARRGFNEVIAARFAEGDIQGALGGAIGWARVEPEEDEAQHALIAMLAISGDRSAALAQYDAFRANLERELQVEPLEQTAAMVEQIRAGVPPERPLLRGAPHAVEEEAAAPPQPTAPDVELDELVERELAPRLQILRKLGESAMSTVYMAREPELKRLLAVKVFSPKLAPDKRARARFQREVEAIASLKHPNIVTLHWAGALSNGLPYFVMEFVQGQTMKEKLAAQRVLPVDDARRALAGIASALAAAHRRGLVHRDIQPANVLCDEDETCAKLADFGIVRLLATAEERPVRITESGELVGDPDWMSPEQLRDKEATRRSDIYGLGLLGYALLTGGSPFEAKTRTEKWAAHARQRPRPLAELRPDVHRDMGLLLEHCLAKDPADRPTAAYLADALEAPAGTKELEEETLFNRLIDRRVPHWVGAHLAGGFGVLELMEMLEARGLFGPRVLDFSIFTYFAATPVVFVLAWYHGKAGRQRFRRLEYWLLGSVAIIWLAVLTGLIFG